MQKYTIQRLNPYFFSFYTFSAVVCTCGELLLGSGRFFVHFKDTDSYSLPLLCDNSHSFGRENKCWG